MFVVTLPSSAAKNPLVFAQKAKRAGADILEIRSDLTPDVTKFSSPVPILVAVRGTDHRLVQHMEPAYVDVETQNFASLPRKSKVILSFHDYKKTPSLATLKALVQKMQKEKPWAVKIATFIAAYDDLLTLTKLQDFLQEKHIRCIILGMGPKAHLSRSLSPLRNCLTYASLQGFDASADGQLPLSFYRLLRVRRPALSGEKRPKIFGILGGPHITASLSPVIHNALFLRHKIDALYSCFPTDHFISTLKILRKLGVQGLSVTAPFKHEAYRISSRKDALSRTLRCANTLLAPSPSPSPGSRFASLSSTAGRGEWHAFNTDGEGILKGYPELALAKTVFILGAGGVVPSIIRACRIASPEVAITVFARDVKKAKTMLVETQNFASLCIKNIREVGDFSCDVIICAVSQDISLPLPKSHSSSLTAHRSLAIDLRYGKTTRFLADAKKAGYRTCDGTAMLIHQALKQFTYFTGKSPKKNDAAYLSAILDSHSL